MSKIIKPKSHTSIDIDHVAKLASLKLTKTERETFSKQLDEILEYASSLDEVDTRKTEPIGHITGLENITREDEAKPSISQQDAISNAEKTHNGLFQVDAIFEDQ